MYAVLVLGSIGGVVAHGYIETPPGMRGHDDYNRNGFWAKVSDTSNKCPGFGTKKFGAKLNSEYPPTKQYSAGENIDIKLNIVAKHKGPMWMDFACMDGHENESTDDASASWTKLVLAGEGGKTEIENNNCVRDSKIASCSGKCICKFAVKAPPENCKHGVLRLYWRNTDGIPQEVFKNCVDITIGNDSPGAVAPSGSNATPVSPSGSNATPVSPSGSNATPVSPSGSTATPVGTTDTADGTGGSGAKIAIVVGSFFLVVCVAGAFLAFRKSTAQETHHPPPRRRTCRKVRLSTSRKKNTRKRRTRR